MSYRFIRRGLALTTVVGLSGLGLTVAGHASAARATYRAPSPSTTTAPATPPPVGTLSTLTYSSPAGSGGGLDDPDGISAFKGNVYVSNSFDNVVSDVTGGNTTTVAGSLEGTGETGDRGPATAATLAEPTGTAEDAAGNIYIADTEDNVIRKINVATGTITRFAGSGVAGDRGLGGPATSAELDFPRGVAVNRWGDVFVADTVNNRVDEVLPNGTIVPFAGDGRSGYSGDGRKATSAELAAPIGLAVDSFGNVYIADSANNVIRRVDARTGIITTVAGNYAADQAKGGLGGFSGDGGPATSAQLNDPEGVALDPAGDLFIADTSNNAIREVTPRGTIYTVVNKTYAGIPEYDFGTPGFNFQIPGPATDSPLAGPSSVAVDNSTGTLYIANTTTAQLAAVTGLAQTGPAAPGPVAPARNNR